MHTTHKSRDASAHIDRVPAQAPLARDRLRLVYVLLYFPYFTETFVAEEIRELRAAGHEVRIISLLPPIDGPVQRKSRQLAGETYYAASLASATLWRSQLYFLVKRPTMYARLFAELMSQAIHEHPIRTIATRLRIFLKAVQVASTLQPDEVQVYHSHFAWLSAAAARICAKLHDRPFTFTAHAYDVFSPKGDMLSLVSRDAAGIVAISEFNRDRILSTTACKPHAVSVVHCGVDTARVTTHVRGTRTSSQTLHILSVGSLVKKKGHHDLIAACGLLRERGVAFFCTIIGAGPEHAALSAQINRLGLRDHVQLAGALPHDAVLDALSTHDVFVLASVVTANGNRDGIPVALMEAAHAAMPIISTNVSGIPELIRNDDTGVLLPSGDVPALANALMLLSSNRNIGRALGARARTAVAKDFSIRGSCVQLAALFAQIAREHPLRHANRVAHTGATRFRASRPTRTPTAS